MFRKNTAGQFIHFQGVDSATGGIKSGVTWTARRCIDGTFAAATGTASEDGTTGWYKFALSQADTNGNNIGFNFTGTGAVPQTVNIVTTACDPTSTAFGLVLAKTTNLTGLNDIAATAIVSAGAITTLSGAVVNVDTVDLCTTTTTTTTATNLTNLPAAAALEATLTTMKGATFAGATDSLEAIRDRGDAAWITATGFATPTNITAATGVVLSGVTHTGAVIPTVTAVTGLTASDVGAIKTQTDKLTFTVANQIDANTQYINDTQLTGDGGVIAPWGPV